MNQESVWEWTENKLSMEIGGIHLNYWDIFVAQIKIKVIQLLEQRETILILWIDNFE